MRGYYKALAAFTTTGAKTVMLIECPAARVLAIESIEVGNANNNTAERWDIAVTRVSTKGTPAGTSITPQKTEEGDAASAATILADLTIEPGAYNAEHLLRRGVSNLTGVTWKNALAQEAIMIPPSGLIGIRLLNSIASTSITITVTYRELG